MTLPEITIYTDGACSPNPGPGGWGAVLLQAGAPPWELSGASAASTNNRMELRAALEALCALDSPHRVDLHTDSKYLRDGITEWLPGWKKRHWLTAGRQPVKNRDLWEALDEAIGRHEIRWHWVKGHSGSRWNERADELAVRARGHSAGLAPGAGAGPSLDAAAIHIHTAVTWSNKSGNGSWVAILSFDRHTRVLGGAVRDTTANRLHVLAAVEGLAALKLALPVHVHTTSGYLRDGAAKWLAGWKRRQWRTKEGAAVSNQDLWQRLDSLQGRHEVEFHLTDRDNPPCAMAEAKELAREYADDLGDD